MPLPKPCEAVIEGEWPTGEILEPLAARYAAAIAIRVAEAVDAKRWSLNEAAHACGIDRETLVRTVSGQSYPDLVTLSALEAGLRISLWPHDIVRVCANADDGDAEM